MNIRSMLTFSVASNQRKLFLCVIFGSYFILDMASIVFCWDNSSCIICILYFFTGFLGAFHQLVSQ
jgi:hypothetical protein